MPVKEEILDIAYQPGMHWKSVNRNIMLAVMDKWAAIQTAERDAEIERLKGLLEQSECKYISLLSKHFCKTNKL